MLPSLFFFFFFFNDTATTEIYTLSLHDALPICERFIRTQDPRQGGPAHLDHRRGRDGQRVLPGGERVPGSARPQGPVHLDRKSTRLNSSHGYISYAVFCLKKKNNRTIKTRNTND